jgi:hypothetical protein
MKASSLATVLLHVVQAAELYASAASRFLRGHAGTHEVVSELLEMETQLVGHAFFEIAASRENSE